MISLDRLRMLRHGTKKRLHVDRKVLAQNKKHNASAPPITVQTSRGPIKCHRARINGPSTLIYNESKPLSCGARVWVETTAEVVIT